jgi:glucose-1-phosphate cytidylyltransferase
VKVVILCGGLGTRLREETEFKPKAMVEIGGKPILWHIMKHYARFGFNEFVLCLGYKGDVIRNYFLNYPVMNSDARIHIGTQRIELLSSSKEEAGWTVTLAETGQASTTAARILRVRKYVSDERFLCTYGDGLSNVDILAVLAFHEKAGRLATVTAVRPITRFGELEVDAGMARRFREKPQLDGWVNGGFFVFEPTVFRYLSEDNPLEGRPLEQLALDGQLAVYQHQGYWMAMDTYREAQALNAEWASGKPGWLDQSPREHRA